MLALVIGCVIAPQVQGQLQYRTVALSGRAAPGTPAGVNYSTFAAPVLNDAGQVAYHASLSGTGVNLSNNSAYFAGTFTSPQLFAREGDAAPGTAVGVRYSDLTVQWPAPNDAGQIAFFTTLTGTGVTGSNNGVIYAGAIAAPQLVARAGNPAPGTVAGVVYGSLESPGLSDMGQVVFLASLSGSGVTPDVNHAAIFAGALASPQLIARGGDPAPGMPAGVTYAASFAPPVINDAGQTAFGAFLTGAPTLNAALYAGGFASPQLIALPTRPAPDTPAGVNYSALSTAALNNAGELVYRASLNGSGINSDNDTAIYAGTSPRLVAREGESAPGAQSDAVYASFSLPAINNAGQITYFATLRGTGMTVDSSKAIFAGPFTDPKLVVRGGDPAPGTGAGITYALQFFDNSPTINDAGQIAYFANLSGAGVTSANGRGLFAFDPNLQDMLIAREGDLFDVGGGDLRTIDDISFRDGPGDDFVGLANDGTVAFRLLFTDGSSGVFTAVVPEPASVMLLGAAALSRLRRQRQS